ncbi:hypothetical protein EDD66_11412 [Mobilisporobacter senegalensis]|uniref:Uncharacterized protein n=1 Tax=Mobilisporobacter senegalensis TaxID=1329262 RepID=A0A3N1X9K2_9FIRM|nr:hypothetical protein EDD66_11412 [Mobilisporobacter senegalensis]
MYNLLKRALQRIFDMIEETMIMIISAVVLSLFKRIDNK